MCGLLVNASGEKIYGNELKGEGEKTLWACSFKMEERYDEVEREATMFLTKDGVQEIYVDGVSVTVGGQRPAIWSIDPQNHTVGGEVVLNGTNLDKAAYVILQTQLGVEFTIAPTSKNSSTHLTFSIPANFTDIPLPQTLDVSLITNSSLSSNSVPLPLRLFDSLQPSLIAPNISFLSASPIMLHVATAMSANPAQPLFCSL